MSYEIIKALHILSAISWMVGLLYLPRLFVYHSQVQVGSVQAEMFKIMERRLVTAIMTPAMIASFIFGIWLISLNHGLIFETWFQIKFATAIFMGGIHGKIVSIDDTTVTLDVDKGNKIVIEKSSLSLEASKKLNGTTK